MNATISGPAQLCGASRGATVGRAAAVGAEIGYGGARALARFVRHRDMTANIALELRRSFGRLGPTYVKLGQLIASSPGVFPRAMSEEFRTLLDAVPPGDQRAVRAVVTAELGADPDEVFASFDPVPLASASIAQVHRATLRTGEQVVVKVQRPGIERRVAADLQILGGIARLAARTDVGRMTNAIAVITDFRSTLAEELDFRLEAETMQQWAASLAASPMAERIRVPEVHWAHTTKRILTMEYVGGTRIDDADAIRAAGHNGEALVKTIALSLFETAFTTGLFHGDLHAGNLAVDDAGRVVFLDFGIAGRLDADTVAALRDICGGLLLTADMAAAARGMLKLGAVGKPAELDVATRDIRGFTNQFVGASIAELSYADLGRQLADLAKRYDAVLPRELVLVGKQLLYVERYIKLLAPGWQLIGDPDVLALFGSMMAGAAERKDATDA